MINSVKLCGKFCLDYFYSRYTICIANFMHIYLKERILIKVLMLNGSPKANGNTNAALLEVGRTLESEGILYEIFQMGGKPVRDCIGCG